MDDDDDVQVLNIKSVSCDNIPDLFLDKQIAKQHFSTFGQIKRFILKTKRGSYSCIVEYETEEAAERALQSAGKYRNHSFRVQYTPETESKPATPDPDIDPDVQAELQALQELSRSSFKSSPDPFIRRVERLPVPVAKIVRPVPRPKPEMERHQKPSAQSEFEALIRKPAISLEEKFRVLDARDKFLRLITEKGKEATKGSCKDMCPEKERLMRAFQNQISIFECSPNTTELDHRLAIKQYSRSSADQEFPLPHELRPESVLNMTMKYLLCNIVDLCDNPDFNLSEWFHFVWDRTRSVRKDITQQDICSLAAVKLVEQCARFHIHCAARLVAEEPSVFDQKINTENLTKCLQSLKYMYHDLSLKGIICPNEGEFRAYIVLLNLNDANFLWELRQLSSRVLNSPEVRFALSVYFAIENHNYVKFFRLVRQTTYLNACLLLRYFNQIRLKAMEVIMKAFTFRQPTAFSIRRLHKLLAFEDEQQTSEFISYHGLRCDAEVVILDKQMFNRPDIPFLLDRAINVVESKRMNSVGETINGGEFDMNYDYENHRPFSSFDENGMYNDSAILALLDTKKDSVSNETRFDKDNLFKIPTLSKPFTKSPTAQKSVVKTFDEADNKVERPFQIPAIPKSSFLSFQQSMQEESTNKNIASGTIFGSTSQQSLFGNFSSASTSKNFVPTPKMGFIFGGQKQDESFEKQQHQQQQLLEAMKKKKEKEELAEQERLRCELEAREAEERRRLFDLREAEEKKRKHMELIIEKSNMALDVLIDQVICKELSKVADTCINQYNNIMKTMANNILCELIEEMISDELVMVADEELLVQQVYSVFKLRQALKFLRLWQKNARRKVDRRRKIENTPIWMPTKALEEQANDFHHPLQNETLLDKPRYLSGSPRQLSATVAAIGQIDPFALLQPILMSGKRNFQGFIQQSVYWKAIISFPLADEENHPGFSAFIDQWISNVFKRRMPRSDRFFLEEHRISAGENRRLVLCLRKVRGVYLERDDLIACKTGNALLFYLSSANLIASRKRLYAVLTVDSTRGAVPLAVIVYNSRVKDIEGLKISLGLEALVEEQLISSYSIFVHEETCKDVQFNLKSLTTRALDFLAKSPCEKNPLEMQTSASFLSKCVGNEFWKRFLSSFDGTALAYRNSLMNINLILDVYNEALERTASLCSHDLTIYPDFPEEFKLLLDTPSDNVPLCFEHFPANWSKFNGQTSMCKFLRALKLCHFSSEWSRGCSVEIVRQYITDNVPNFISLDKFMNLVHLTVETEKYPEVKIVMCLTEELLRMASQFKHLPGFVIYHKDEFRDYSNIPWWLEKIKFKSVAKQRRIEIDETQPNVKKSRQDDKDIMDRAFSSAQAAEKKLQNYRKIIEQNSKTKFLETDLYENDKYFRESKKVWQKFEGLMKN